MSIDRFWILAARKLSGESSLEEIRELEELLRSNPHLYFSKEIITNLWNQQPKKDDLELEISYASHLHRMSEAGIIIPHEQSKDEADNPYLIHGSRKTKMVRRLAIAASFLVVGSIAIILSTTGRRQPAAAEKLTGLAVSTKNGSRTSMQLPDGSKVWLNSGSTITYDKQFGKDIREVVLSGEAFFDVVRNPEKPFIIHTTSMDIKVLGTRFNVKSYANDKVSEASLVHGSIEVSLKKRGSEKILLKPNEKIVVMNDRIVENDKKAVSRQVDAAEPIISVQKLHYATKDSAIIETSWVDNRLIFENESFQDIAVKMERWFGMKVQFQDVYLKNERLTGSFTNETIDQALHALQMTTPFSFIIKENTVMITK